MSLARFRAPAQVILQDPAGGVESVIRQTEIPDVRSHRGDTRGVLSLKRCQNRPVAESGPFVADAGAVFLREHSKMVPAVGTSYPKKVGNQLCAFS